MTTTTDNSSDQEQKQDGQYLQLRELLAFNLYRLSEKPSGSLAGECASWRNDLDDTARASFRYGAEKLIRHLEDQGMEIKVKKSRKLEDAISTLLTIPASIAYNLLDAEVRL